MADRPRPTPHERYLRAVNRLARWRTVFTGWQLGTRSIGDPEADAVRDHREATLILQAEVSAIFRLLRDHVPGISQDRVENAIAEEADWKDEQLAGRFPGFSTTDEGLTVDVAKAAETTKGWRP